MNFIDLLKTDYTDATAEQMNKLKDSINETGQANINYQKTIEQIKLDKFINKLEKPLELLNKQLNLLDDNISNAQDGFLSGLDEVFATDLSDIGFDMSISTKNIDDVIDTQINQEEELQKVIDEYDAKKFRKREAISN